MLEKWNKYWKSQENLADRKVKTMEIRCHTLNKKQSLKNNGKVREIRQSEKVAMPCSFCDKYQFFSSNYTRVIFAG